MVRFAANGASRVETQSGDLQIHRIDKDLVAAAQGFGRIEKTGNSCLFSSIKPQIRLTGKLFLYLMGFPNA